MSISYPDHFLEEMPVLDAVEGTTIIYVASGTNYLTYQLAVSVLFFSSELTGAPTAPTAPPGTNTTQIATTEFVLANAPSSGITVDETPVSGGTAGRVLFEGAGAVVTDSPDLTFVSNILAVGIAGSATISCPGAGTFSEQIGANAQALGDRVTAIGNSAGSDTDDTSDYSTMIGFGANANGSDATAIGVNANAAERAIAIGSGATASGRFSIAIGEGAATTSDDDSIAIGNGASTSGTAGIVLGSYSFALDSGIAIGYNAAADSNQLVFGSSSNPITDILVDGGTPRFTLSNSSTSFGIKGAPSQTAPLLGFQGISSTFTARDLGYVDAGFISSTDATYTGYLDLDANDFNGRRKGLRVASDGTQATLSTEAQLFTTPRRFALGETSNVPTGDGSFNIGAGNSLTATGYASLTVGASNSVGPGNFHGMAYGFNNQISGLADGGITFAMGWSNTISGGAQPCAVIGVSNSVISGNGNGAFGYSCQVNASNSFALGIFCVLNDPRVLGFGTASIDSTLRFQGGSTTSNSRDLMDLKASWVDSTDATRKAKVTLSAYDWVAPREGLAVAADGTQSLLGFHGATPVAKPTGDILVGLKAQGLNASPALLSTETVLGSNFILTVTGSFANTGLTLSLPSAGSYLINANVRVTLLMNSGDGFIAVALYDVTNTVILPNSIRLVWLDSAGTGKSYQLHSAYSWFITTTSAITLRLYAKRDGGGSFFTAQITSDSNGSTTFGFVRIGS